MQRQLLDLGSEEMAERHRLLVRRDELREQAADVRVDRPRHPSDTRGLRWRFRLVLGLLTVVAAVATGCGDSDHGTSASMPDAAEAARLAADAVSRSCAYECSTLQVYLQTDLVSQHSSAGTMPEPTRDALTESFPDAQFVDSDEADALFGPDFLVDSGRGVLVTVGPVERLADDVVGVEVGVYTARDGARGEIVQYQWSDAGWRHARSEDTGVTVTTWVS